MGVYSGNRTLLGESVSSNNIGHVLDMVIECERNDLHLFEAVINCDMIEAFTEAGLTTLVKEDADNAKQESKKSIGRKIKELFTKAYEAIKRFIATFIAKVSNFFSNDAKLLKQYTENFDKNAIGYKVSSWRPIKIEDLNDLISDFDEKGLSEFNNILANTTRDIGNASDNDGVDKAMESCKKFMKELDYAKYIENRIWDKDAKEDYALTGKETKLIKETMKNGKATINKVKNMGNYAIKYLKELQRELKFSKYEVDEKDNLALSKINAEYKAANLGIKYCQKALNATVNAFHRVLAQCRKAFVVAGKNATEQKATKESALYDYILGEASDIYVESALSMS